MAERDIVYKLQVAAGDDVSKNLKTFERDVGKAYEKTTKAAKTSGRAQVSSQQDSSDKIIRSIDKQGVALDGLTKKINRVAEATKLSGEKGNAKATEQVRQFRGSVDAANKGIQAGFHKSVEGVLTLGRGIAFLSASGEEDIKKIVIVLMKVQSVMDLTRGGIALYQGITTAVNAYRAAVLAAAAAEGVLGAARLSSGAAGIGAAGLGAAGAAAGKGALGAGARSAMHLAAGAGSMSFALPAAILGGVAGAATLGDWGGFRSKRVSRMAQSGDYDPGTWKSYGAGLLEQIPFFGEGYESQPGRTWGEWNAQGESRMPFKQETVFSRREKALSDKERLKADESTRLSRIEYAREQSSNKLARDIFTAEGFDRFKERGFDRREDLATMGQKSRGLRGLRGEVQGRKLLGGAGSNLRDLGNLTAQMDISMRIVAAEQDRLRIAKEIGAVSVQSGRETLSLSERQRDVARQTFSEAKDRLKSDLERFAGLDTEQQGRLRVIRRKVDAGLTLNQTETALAGQFGEFGEAASRSAVKRAKLAGADDIFRADRAAVLAAKAKAKETEKIVIRREEDLRILVERDESLVGRILDQVKLELLKSERIQAKQLKAAGEIMHAELNGIRATTARGTTGR